MFDRDNLRTKSAVLINDSFQNRKQYNIPKAQLVIADIPYNLGVNAYASSRQWYKDGGLLDGYNDGNSKEHYSDKAGKQFFATDNNFNLAEFFHFCQIGRASCRERV